MLLKDRHYLKHRRHTPPVGSPRNYFKNFKTIAHDSYLGNRVALRHDVNSCKAPLASCGHPCNTNCTVTESSRELMTCRLHQPVAQEHRF